MKVISSSSQIWINCCLALFGNFRSRFFLLKFLVVLFPDFFFNIIKKKLVGILNFFMFLICRAEKHFILSSLLWNTSFTCFLFLLQSPFAMCLFCHGSETERCVSPFTPSFALKSCFFWPDFLSLARSRQSVVCFHTPVTSG